LQGSETLLEERLEAQRRVSTFEGMAVVKTRFVLAMQVPASREGATQKPARSLINNVSFLSISISLCIDIIGRQRSRWKPPNMRMHVN
jgi:hypothetical protein